MDIKLQIENRKIFNELIIKELSEIVESHPEMRFGQILYNFTSFDGAHDFFYEESYDSYQEIQKIKKYLNGKK